MDWGPLSSKSHKAVREAVRIEIEAAHARGVSVRREQLGLIPGTSLTALMKRHHVAEGFAPAMRTAAEQDAARRRKH
jgi:hypothetical protein